MRPLIRAAHLAPSLVVTVVTVGLGVAAGLPAGRLGLLGAAILSGQLSIGWSNDWIDAGLGRDAGRADKPTATGAVDPATLRTAAVAALAICALLSAGLGAVPAAVHLVAVAGGWAYNVGLKATVASVVPYAVSFGLLPVIVATADAQPGGAPWWAVLTAACFGAGVHFANALPDLAVDARTGVRGLPQRLGAGGSVVATVLLLGGGAATVLLAPGSGGPLTVAGTVGAAGLLSLMVLAAVRERADLAFRVAMLTGLLVVGVLVARGDALA